MGTGEDGEGRRGAVGRMGRETGEGQEQRVNNGREKGAGAVGELSKTKAV